MRRIHGIFSPAVPMRIKRLTPTAFKCTGRLSRSVAAALIAVSVSAVSACDFRPLTDPNLLTEVRVRINNDGIQNVTCDVYNPDIPVQKIEPTAMHVLFYNAGDGSVAAESFITKVSTDGEGYRVLSGEVQLLPGSYRMLAYDFGTDATVVKDYYIWDKAEAYTDPVPSGVLSRFNTRGVERSMDIRVEPEHLPVARLEKEVIPYHDDIVTVTAEARSVVESWYVQVYVDGVEWVNSAQAVLSGMVGENLIATDTRVTAPETAVWFSLRKGEDKGRSVICAVFNTFGRIPDSDGKLEMTFDVSTADRKIIRKTFDVSGLFLTENAILHHWLLIDETIKVEPPKSSGGAFDPKIDDWDEENRDIDI